MKSVEETRSEILTAAEARFQLYGFNKTTMAEIAGDCGMSAGNLYRFFKSKSDIGVGLAEIHFAKEAAIQREVIDYKHLTPSEKFQEFVLSTLRFQCDCHSNYPKINEMVDFLCSERFDLIEKHKASRKSLLAELLALGNQAAEFAVEDVVETAEMICKATIMFDYPPLIAIHSREELERTAVGVVKLLLNGIKRR